MSRITPTFAEVQNAVIHLSGLIAEYSELYLKSSERVDLLNKAAPAFFAELQIVLGKSILLAIARLGDPAEQRKHRNASLEAAVKEVEEECGQQLDKSLLAAFNAAAQPIRPHRDKHIAHADYETLVEKTNVLNGVTERDLRSALTCAVAIIQACRKALGENEISLPPIGLDAGSLIYTIQDGLRLRQMEREIQLRLQDLDGMSARQLWLEISRDYLWV